MGPDPKKTGPMTPPQVSSPPSKEQLLQELKKSADTKGIPVSKLIARLIENAVERPKKR